MKNWNEMEKKLEEELKKKRIIYMLLEKMKKGEIEGFKLDEEEEKKIFNYLLNFLEEQKKEVIIELHEFRGIYFDWINKQNWLK